jgi:rfaE bifunctional protein nucleotidyltransferase chain/domain
MMDLGDKLKTFEEISRELEIVREDRPDVRIVTTNGAFDILHAGHIESLALAKSYGDLLIVGLNSDASVRKYKSVNRPIIPEADRAKMLSALYFVDYVVMFDETDPREFLKRINPTYHVKSRKGYLGIEGDVVREGGGKVVLVDDIPGLSTSDIVKKISECENSNRG